MSYVRSGSQLYTILEIRNGLEVMLVQEAGLSENFKYLFGRHAEYLKIDDA